MDVAWLANKLDGLHGKIHHINHAGWMPSEQDQRDLIAFLSTLQPPPNPFLSDNGTLTLRSSAR